MKYLTFLIILCLSFPIYAQTGIASWYGNESIVSKYKGYTANGEKFNENKLTCAMPNKKDMNKWYKVTNIENGKSVIVWCNDIGNLKKYGRNIDLSKRAFSLLGNLKKGLLKVKIKEIRK